MSLTSSIIGSVRQASKRTAVSITSQHGFASSSRSRGEGKSTIQKVQTISSCPPGTTFHGLNILKDKSDPVSKPDEEYPSWLWNIIPDSKASALADAPKQTPSAGQPFDYAQEKRRLKAINKAKIKASNFLRGS